MDIEISADMAKRLEEAIVSGRFASVDDAVALGLTLLLTESEDEELADGVPARIANLLDISAEDLRLGRLVDAGAVLADMDVKIADYQARQRARAAG